MYGMDSGIPALGIPAYGSSGTGMVSRSVVTVNAKGSVDREFRRGHGHAYGHAYERHVSTYGVGTGGLWHQKHSSDLREGRIAARRTVVDIRHTTTLAQQVQPSQVRAEGFHIRLYGHRARVRRLGPDQPPQWCTLLVSSGSFIGRWSRLGKKGMEGVRGWRHTTSSHGHVTVHRCERITCVACDLTKKQARTGDG